MENLYRNTAWLYDLDNRDLLQDDIPFYLEYAKQLGGAVLELGCGTGRVSLALAREGITVTSLDFSREMLAVFQNKLLQEPIHVQERISIQHGNMAQFQYSNQFSLIIAPFRAFQALTADEDIASCLGRVKEHLCETGRFIVNVFQPYSCMDESWCYPETIQWERRDEFTGNYVVKRHWGDKIDLEQRIIYPHFAYEVTDKFDNKSRWIEDLQLKYYYEPQLEAILTQAGFRTYDRFGWYDKQSITQAQRELIFVCGR